MSDKIDLLDAINNSNNVRFSADEPKWNDEWSSEYIISLERKLAEREKDLLAVERNYNIQQETIEKLKEMIVELKNKADLSS